MFLWQVHFDFHPGPVPFPVKIKFMPINLGGVTGVECPKFRGSSSHRDEDTFFNRVIIEVKSHPGTKDRVGAETGVFS